MIVPLPNNVGMVFRFFVMQDNRALLTTKPRLLFHYVRSPYPVLIAHKSILSISRTNLYVIKTFVGFGEQACYRHFQQGFMQIALLACAFYFQEPDIIIVPLLHQVIG